MSVDTASVQFATAVDTDAAAIATLCTAVAQRLTQDFGKGHWSGAVTKRSVLRAVQNSRVMVVRNQADIIATLRLATKKPWAINPKYFTPVRRPLYLTAMAVDPAAQRTGIGRQLLRQATDAARAWPSDAIRLDSYDAAAGAGPFYAKCGFHEVGRVTFRGTPLIYFEMVL